jgi:hypothetical protein
MRPREAAGVTERGHERGGRDRPDAPHALQALDAGIRMRPPCVFRSCSIALAAFASSPI